MEDLDPRNMDDDEVEPDELEAEMLRADRPYGTDRWGTTAEEAEAGEGLDRALAQEEPVRPATEEAFELVDDELTDDEDELIGTGSVEHDEFAAPEEAAVHVEEEAPGVTDHPERPLPDEDVDAVEAYLDDTER